MWRPVYILSALCLVKEVFGSQGLEGQDKPCAAGHFYQQSTNSCLPCSGCSNYEVVRRPCSEQTDTVCGPFKEFKFFRQPGDGNSDVSEDEKGLQRGAEKTELHLTIYSEGGGQSMRNVAVTESEESQHWRTVAFALIGALSALVFLGTLVVLVTCRRITQARTPANPRPEDDDVDCPYVVIHTIRPSASDEELTYQVPPGPNALHQLARQRQRLYKYHPKRRLLQANEYADDVFESEDSAGSRRWMSLQVIPETEHSESEADSSPQPSTALPRTQPPSPPPGSSLSGEDPPASRPFGDPSHPLTPPSSAPGEDDLPPSETSELLSQHTASESIS